MTIFPNKKVFTDVNSQSIGSIEKEIIPLIKKNLKSNSPWFRTRNKLDVCKDCAYCFLCPSPSNYETVIGKPNLCHI
jgi:pseudo-rSAM protein